MPQAVESLVTKLLAQSDFYSDLPEDERKSRAWAIAQEQYNEGHLSAGLDTITFTSVESPAQITLEASEDGEIIKFENAILARAEVNRNRDEITEENITELAASIVGRAVDIEHRTNQNAGIITAARPQNGILHIDGLLWRDRYPEEVDGVRSGTHHLSVEARADFAVCSKCGGEFGDSKHYCAHLKAKKNAGARRGFRGLRGKGAGITRSPAGTGTNFDRNRIYVVAHTELEAEEEKKMECPHCGKSVGEGEKCSACGKNMQASVIAKELAKALEDLNALKAEGEQEKATLTASLAEKQSELDAAQAKLSETEAALKAKQDAERETHILAFLPEDKWAERKEHLLALPEDAFNTVLASLEDASKKAPPAAGMRSLPNKTKNESSTRAKIALR